MSFFNSLALAFQREGAVWMWGIFFVQMISLAIIVERIISLYLRRRIDGRKLIKNFEADIKRGDLQTVITKAEGIASQHPIGYVIAAGSKAAINLGGQSEVQAKMDEVLLEENAFLEKRTSFLAMLANVGTLVGLLGTVTGMIKSFAAVGEANPMEKATLLSMGISEAMNATAYGLIMAIPALFFYGVLQNRANALAEDLNQSALKVFNWLTYSFEAIPVKQALRAQKKTQESELHSN